MINFNDDVFQAIESIFAKNQAPATFHETDPFASGLWEQLGEAGFTSIGSDGAVEDHAAVAKAVGKWAVALPIVEVGLARWLADQAGLEISDDEVVVVAGLNPGDRILADRDDAAGLHVRGTVHRVPWARAATSLLVPVTVGDSVRWALVDMAGTELAESVNYASEPRDDVMIAGRHIPADRIGVAGPRAKEVRARGALMRAVSSLGAMEYVLEMTLGFTEERYQFGVPISSFQAVQQHLVAVAEAVASVGAAAAAAVYADPAERLMRVAVVKTVVGEQITLLTRSAHQVHGAIGATAEYPLQSRTRRLWSWQDEFGTTNEWAVELADQLVFEESPGAWMALTPPHAALTARDIAEGVPW